MTSRILAAAATAVLTLSACGPMPTRCMAQGERGTIVSVTRVPAPGERRRHPENDTAVVRLRMGDGSPRLCSGQTYDELSAYGPGDVVGIRRLSRTAL